MNNHRILIIGLLAASAIGAAVIILLQVKHADVIARKEAELSALKKTLSVRAEEHKDVLAARDHEVKLLLSDLAKLHCQLTALKAQAPNSPVQPGPTAEEKKPVQPKVPVSDKMRRYAAGILKVYGQGGDHNAYQKDQALQAVFMEFMAELLQFSAKYNIKIDMFGGEGADICKAYAIPEMRQWFGQVGAALFEEMGFPLDTTQLAAIDKLMARTGEETRKIDDLPLTELEKAIMLQQFNIKQCDEFIRALTPEQNSKLSYDIALIAMTGNDTCESLFSKQLISTAKSREQCAGDLVNRWASYYRLDNAKTQSVKYLADTFVSEYAAAKTQAEAEYGKEFMDYYLVRWSGDWQKWSDNKKQYFKSAENRRKKDVLDLRFAELELKYRNSLQSALPEESEEIKERGPELHQFPYLEN